MPGAPYLPNYNVTAARARGGVYGGAAGRMNAPQGPRSPIFGAARQVASGPPAPPARPGYGSGTFSSTGTGKKEFDPEKQAQGQYRGLQEQQNYRSGREVSSNQAYDDALATPEVQARRFRDIYQEAATAMAAPGQRRFQQDLNSNLGNVASRFGGNASTEELRGAYGISDVFARAMAEQMAQLGVQGANAGMQHTAQLGDRANSAGNGVDNSSQLLGLWADKTKKKGGGFGGFIGTALGAGAGALIGQPGLGAGVGGKIGGSF